MALCSNSTSLYELAFGVNAVYTVLALQVSDVKTQISDITIENFKAVDPTFNVEPTERSDFELWVSQCAKGFKIANIVRLVPQIMSVAFVLTATVTLYQNAIWKNCFIDDAALGVFTFFSLIFAPLVYFSFGAFLKFLVRIIGTLSFKNDALTGFYIEAYRTHLKAREHIRITDAMLKSARDKQAEMDLRQLWHKLWPFVHPVQALIQCYKNYHVNKVRKLVHPKSQNHKV